MLPLLGWGQLLFRWRPLLLGRRPLLLGWRPPLLGATATRLASAIWLDAIAEASAIWLEAIAARSEAIVLRLEATALRLEPWPEQVPLRACRSGLRSRPTTWRSTELFWQNSSPKSRTYY